MIKDLLALANNNTVTAGENAYLIIGADDRIKRMDPDIHMISILKSHQSVKSWLSSIHIATRHLAM
jgi:hypothetical protein